MNIYNLLYFFPWKIVLSKFVNFFFFFSECNKNHLG